MDGSNAIAALETYGPPVLFGYLVGSIPFGLLITKLAGLGDIRAIGSGNIGATNVLRTGRRDLALATLVLDAGKAGCAFLICLYYGLFMASFAHSGHVGDTEVAQRQLEAASSCDAYSIGLIGGAFAFVGHCFPVWLKFKGGKGVATFLGLILAAMWQVGLGFGFIWLLTVAVFRMSSLAGLLATLATPIMAYVLNPVGEGWIITSVLAALIFWRHRANIARILSGSEPKIGAKKKADDLQDPAG